MKVILAGGGTGGHLFPAIAVAEELLSANNESEVLFVVDRLCGLTGALKSGGFCYRRIAGAKLRGVSNIARLTGIVFTAIGLLQALLIVWKYKPRVVVGFGGYASCPVILAGVLSGRTTVIHEQNRLVGLTNRFLARFVTEVELSYAETKFAERFANVYVTGNPVRRSIVLAHKSDGLKLPAAGKGKYQLVIFGGSLGAGRINRCLPGIISVLRNSHSEMNEWNIVHITGAIDYHSVDDTYRQYGIDASVFAFVEDMDKIYKSADLVVCRAGGTTVAELTAIGLPAVYIPYPQAADDHQLSNAMRVCRNGGGIVIADADMEDRLGEVLLDLMRTSSKREVMAAASRKLGRPDAACLFAKRVTSLAKMKGS